MTDVQLDAVEADLGVRLPEAYRRACREAAPEPGGAWLFDHPESVVNSTRCPLDEGDYGGPELLPRYVAVGDSGAGDLWLLDLETDGTPVPCLSHETHAVEPEWPSFAAFDADRRAAPALRAASLAAEAAERAVWWRWRWKVSGVIFLLGVVLPLLLALLARWRAGAT